MLASTLAPLTRKLRYRQHVAPEFAISAESSAQRERATTQNRTTLFIEIHGQNIYTPTAHAEQA
jgi:hypothetical protein